MACKTKLPPPNVYNRKRGAASDAFASAAIRRNSFVFNYCKSFIFNYDVLFFKVGGGA
jgi:hypothetical protein